MTRILYCIFFAGHLIVTLLYIVSGETILAASSVLSHRRDPRQPDTDEQQMRGVANTRFDSSGHTQQDDIPTTSQSNVVSTYNERARLIPTEENEDTVPTTYGFYSSESRRKKLFFLLNLMKVFSLIWYLIWIASNW